MDPRRKIESLISPAPIFEQRFARSLLIFALTLLQPGSALSQSIFGGEFEKFVKDNVKFAGFIENTSGLAISHGSHFFDTANRFDTNRFTIQPEFNIKFRDDLTSFISWRFIKEPRYSMESKSREQSVAPAPNGTPLTSAYYHEQSPHIYRLDVIAVSGVIVNLPAKSRGNLFLLLAVMEMVARSVSGTNYPRQ